MNRLNALNGCLVGDAASMGLHWIYDQEQISRIAATGDVLFRAPDENHYRNQTSYFAHGAKRVGELSNYGEQLRVVGEVALSTAGYTSSAHRQAFMRSLGPCGSYEGYADRPTRALIARMLVEADDLKDPSGMDDDQNPVLAVVPGLFAAGAGESDIRLAASVISTHPAAVESALILWTCLERIEQGSDLESVLHAAADMATGIMREKLHEALDWPRYAPLDIAMHFGMACHLIQSMPIVWHLLLHATGFEQCVRDNVLCGGDTCGRSLALCSMAACVFGLPNEMKGKVSDSLF